MRRDCQALHAGINADVKGARPTFAITEYNSDTAGRVLAP